MARTKQPTIELLTLDEVAERSGLTKDSIRVYHGRATRARRAGTARPQDLPAPDFTLGRIPAWRPETIDAWNDARAESRRKIAS